MKSRRRRLAKLSKQTGLFEYVARRGEEVKAPNEDQNLDQGTGILRNEKETIAKLQMENDILYVCLAAKQNLEDAYHAAIKNVEELQAKVSIQAAALSSFRRGAEMAFRLEATASFDKLEDIKCCICWDVKDDRECYVHRRCSVCTAVAHSECWRQNKAHARLQQPAKQCPCPVCRQDFESPSEAS